MVVYFYIHILKYIDMRSTKKEDSFSTDELDYNNNSFPLERFFVRLKKPFYVADNGFAHEVLKILNDSKRFKEEFIPLSPKKQDTSDGGTRTIKGILKSYPDRIIVLSGLGVVKCADYPSSHFIVTPPHWRETVDKYIELGHSQVSAEGHVWSHNNTTTFGAYDLTDLKQKIHNTHEYSGLINNASDLEILLAGEHKRSAQHGWMIYAIPAGVVRLTELQLTDLIERDDVNEPGKYSQFIVELFSKLRLLHAKGVAHLELHPGNCFPVYENDGELRLLITDWTTAQSFSDFPNDKELSALGYFKDKKLGDETSPIRTAITIDLRVAMENLLLMSNGYIDTNNEDRNISKFDISSFRVTEAVVKIQLTYFAVAIAAYLGLDQENNTVGFVRSILEKLMSNFIIPGILENDRFVRADWSASDGHLENMDRPGHLVQSSFSILAEAISNFLATEPSTVGYDELQKYSNRSMQQMYESDEVDLVGLDKDQHRKNNKWNDFRRLIKKVFRFH